MKSRLFKTVFAIILMALSVSTLEAQSLFRSSQLFLGEKPSTWETGSTNPQVFIGPNFGIESYENGLNFWRPYPLSNWGNYKLFIDPSGKIGLGRKPTTYALEVNGQVWTTSGLLITSDGVLKKNVLNISDSKETSLSKIKKLNGKSYEKQIFSANKNAEEVARMVEQGKIKQADAQAALMSLNKTNSTVYKKEFGFIAQEVKEVFPELVEESADGIYAVNYTGLIPVLLEAIKELQTKVESLETQKFSSTEQLSSLRSSEATANEDIISSEDAKLYDSSGASVTYVLPATFTSASLQVYDMTGRLLKNVKLENGGNRVDLNSNEIGYGTFIYALVVDGQKRDTLKKYVSR